jgi:hypothetical protein
VRLDANYSIKVHDLFVFIELSLQHVTKGFKLIITQEVWVLLPSYACVNAFEVPVLTRTTLIQR